MFRQGAGRNAVLGTVPSRPLGAGPRAETSGGFCLILAVRRADYTLAHQGARVNRRSLDPLQGTVVHMLCLELHMNRMFLAVLHDDGGQGLAEYGLILGLIAVLCIAAVVFLSGAIQGILSNVGSSI